MQVGERFIVRVSRIYRSVEDGNLREITLTVLDGTFEGRSITFLYHGPLPLSSTEGGGDAG